MGETMALMEPDHRQIDLGSSSKSDLRTQFGALCYRIIDGKLRFCVVTSRRSGRWIMPKGWPVDGATPRAAAATEAFEEAGIEGKVGLRPLGVYSYYKSQNKNELPCIAVVYPLRVKKIHSRWPERKERKRKWVSRKKAAQMVANPELAEMILAFDPHRV